jgi:hypothetical protein
MTMYMTKTWGFSVPCGPLQFSLSGFRDRARGLLQPGDLVAIVGTFGANTPEEERGMILGLMEPPTVVVSSLDYFDLDAVREVDSDEHGNYRWPFGLELRAAWRFTEPRTALGDISARQFHMDSAQGIVPLLPNEAEAILNLPREPVPLLSPLRARVRVEGLNAARRRAAPPPSTTRTGIMHIRRAPAFTYAMRLEGATTSAFKIGGPSTGSSANGNSIRRPCLRLAGCDTARSIRRYGTRRSMPFAWSRPCCATSTWRAIRKTGRSSPR